MPDSYNGLREQQYRRRTRKTAGRAVATGGTQVATVATVEAVLVVVATGAAMGRSA